MREPDEAAVEEARMVVFAIKDVSPYSAVRSIARALMEAKQDGMLEAARMIEQNWIDGLPPMCVATSIRKGASREKD